jgi:hypothetical protein
VFRFVHVGERRLFVVRGLVRERRESDAIGLEKH